LTRTRTANREKPLPHKLCSFTPSYLNALIVQHLYSVFFNVWFGMVQHKKQLGCREDKKSGENIPILQS